MGHPVLASAGVPSIAPTPNNFGSTSTVRGPDKSCPSLNPNVCEKMGQGAC